MELKRLIKYILIHVLIILFLGNNVHSQIQNVNNIQISYTATNKSAVSIINDLEKNYRLNFRYKYKWISDLYLDIDEENLILNQFLTKLFKNTNITFLVVKPNLIVLLQDHPASLNVSVNNRNDIDSLITLGTPTAQLFSDTVTLYGIIRSGETSELVPGVTAQDLKSNANDITDFKGYYALKVPTGYRNIKYQSVEFGEYSFNILLNSTAEFNLELFPSVIRLKDIVVRGLREDINVSETITGVERITAEEIKSIPALLGEADVIKSVTSLPGVNVIGEASAGFNVRGIGPGGNLVLLDNATLFNTSHLFGVFTAFSPDAVQDVALYKGTVPAKYGGRISSVLDVNLKAGNKEKIKGSGGVGIISSRFNIETPIIKGKSSLSTGLRLAYPNWILRSVRNNDLKNSSSFFGDFNIKYHHVLDKRNLFSGTIYFSEDDFSIVNQVTYDYQNATGSFQWSHIFSDDLSSEFSFNSSRYNYGLKELADATNQFKMDAWIQNNDFRADFTYVKWDNHLVDFGVQSTFYNLQPGEFNAESDVLEATQLSDLNFEEGIESSIYASDEIRLNNNISTYVGARLNMFTNLKGSDYFGLEPRISINYQLENQGSIKFGYNRMRQNIHLITNTVAVTPVDLWKLSGNTINPVIADQFSIGFFRNLFENNIETSAEVYYRNIENLIEFKNGASLFGNPNVEEELVQGKGMAYGLELYLRKNRGLFTGWLSYSYSRTLARIDENNLANPINNGDLFPTNIDQPHNLNLYANLKTSRRFDISFNFIYSTGRPLTVPTSAYDFTGVSVLNYGLRNNERIPDYHRLDISFHLGTSLKKAKKLEADWTLTLYNVYSRRNAFSVFYQTSPRGTRNEAFKLSIIGQIIPALTYNFKF